MEMASRLDCRQQQQPATRVHARSLRAGQHVRFAELAYVPVVLLEPAEAELRVGVKVVLCQETVNELQGCLYRHCGAVSFEHGAVLRENRHAGADDRLREVDGRDRGMQPLAFAGHRIERQRKGFVEFACELATGDLPR